MQKNKSIDIAKNIIRSAKGLLGDKINNIAIFNVTDEPYNMFSIKCTMYNYFIFQFNYDRGSIGGAIVLGDDAIPLSSTMEWEEDCDFSKYWKEIDNQIKLRIPDKYLKANGWWR